MLDITRYQWFTKESIANYEFDQHPQIGELVFDQLYETREEAVDHLHEYDEYVDATLVAADEGWELVRVHFSLER